MKKLRASSSTKFLFVLILVVSVCFENSVGQRLIESPTDKENAEKSMKAFESFETNVRERKPDMQYFDRISKAFATAKIEAAYKYATQNIYRETWYSLLVRAAKEMGAPESPSFDLEGNLDTVNQNPINWINQRVKERVALLTAVSLAFELNLAESNSRRDSAKSRMERYSVIGSILKKRLEKKNGSDSENEPSTEEELIDRVINIAADNIEIENEEKISDLIKRVLEVFGNKENALKPNRERFSSAQIRSDIEDSEKAIYSYIEEVQETNEASKASTINAALISLIGSGLDNESVFRLHQFASSMRDELEKRLKAKGKSEPRHFGVFTKKLTSEYKAFQVLIEAYDEEAFEEETKKEIRKVLSNDSLEKFVTSYFDGSNSTEDQLSVIRQALLDAFLEVKDSKSKSLKKTAFNGYVGGLARFQSIQSWVDGFKRQSKVLIQLRTLVPETGDIGFGSLPGQDGIIAVETLDYQAGRNDFRNNMRLNEASVLATTNARDSAEAIKEPGKSKASDSAVRLERFLANPSRINSSGGAEGEALGASEIEGSKSILKSVNEQEADIDSIVATEKSREPSHKKDEEEESGTKDLEKFLSGNKEIVDTLLLGDEAAELIDGFVVDSVVADKVFEAYPELSAKLRDLIDYQTEIQLLIWHQLDSTVALERLVSIERQKHNKVMANLIKSELSRWQNILQYSSRIYIFSNLTKVRNELLDADGNLKSSADLKTLELLGDDIWALQRMRPDAVGQNEYVIKDEGAQGTLDHYIFADIKRKVDSAREYHSHDIYGEDALNSYQKLELTLRMLSYISSMRVANVERGIATREMLNHEMLRHRLAVSNIKIRTDTLYLKYGISQQVLFNNTGLTYEDIETVLGFLQTGLLAWLGVTN
ncbi:MAG: hypothetical protein AAF558_14165 [Verrucomicrobiota bacterium]